MVRGYRNEGLTFLERALGEARDWSQSVRAKALLAAARLSFMQSDYRAGQGAGRGEPGAVSGTAGTKEASASRSIGSASLPGGMPISQPRGP